MIDSIKFRYNLWQLQRKKRNTEDFYRKLLNQADASKKSREEKDEIISEHLMERDLVDDAIQNLVTMYLIQKAEIYLLPRPERGNENAWVDSKINPGYCYLSPQAISQLRTEIRKEQKERYEHGLMWLAALTGLVGAVSGLVAVIAAI